MHIARICEEHLNEKQCFRKIKDLYLRNQHKDFKKKIFYFYTEIIVIIIILIYVNS